MIKLLLKSVKIFIQKTKVKHPLLHWLFHEENSDVMRYLPIYVVNMLLIIVTAARAGACQPEGCSILHVFFISFFITNLRQNGRTPFGAKYGRT